jgi:nucleoside-diphosphate-sugar epimerase
MAVLVTGGTGFVGLNIVEALLARRQMVVVLDRAEPPAAAASALAALGTVAWRQGDVTDSATLDAAFREHGIDRLVQGAAITADAAREARAARRIAEVNLLGSIEVLEAARRHGVGRVVYLSSASELDEATTPPLPDSLYAITKYAGERTALRYITLFGMEVAVARLSGVFGPWERDTGVRDTLSPIHQATTAALAGSEVVLARTGTRDWVYAPDVASAVATLLLQERPPAHTVYNVGPGTVWSVADWCRKLQQRRPDFAWRLGDDVTIDLHGDRDRSPLAIRRLTEDTDWRPEFGLEAAFEHYMTWLERQAPE